MNVDGIEMSFLKCELLHGGVIVADFPLEEIFLSRSDMKRLGDQHVVVNGGYYIHVLGYTFGYICHTSAHIEELLSLPTWVLLVYGPKSMAIKVSPPHSCKLACSLVHGRWFSQ